MPCTAIQSWTLSSLVGAYLDLSIAFLLLVGATLAFLASKFLAFFGLSLPCSCDGLFGRPHCVHRLLAEEPLSTVASVQSALRSRFPFDSICTPPPCRYDVRFLDDDSCASVSTNLTLPGPPATDDDQAALGDARSTPGAKGKALLTGPGSRPPTPPCGGVGLRRRRRRKGRPPSIPPSQPGYETSPAAFHWRKSDDFSASSSHGRSDDPFDFVQGAATPADECKPELEKTVLHYDVDGNGDRNDASFIRALEQALDEEQSSRAALYVELEKERSAAATATDEAMAMILRLQEEKAAVEMQARQYHRMIEEKSAYDEEEMEILKEIIVRREREKHVLEKEVEAYRRILPQIPFGPAFGGSPEDLVPMLQQICESFGEAKQDYTSWFTEDVPAPSGLADYAGSSRQGYIKQTEIVEKHLQEVGGSGYGSDLQVQEKDTVTMCEIYSSSMQSPQSGCEKNSISGKSQALGFPEDSSNVADKEDDARNYDKVEMSPPFQDLYTESDSDAVRTSMDSSIGVTESRIHDVHVIDDRLGAINEGNRKENDPPHRGGTSGAYRRGGLMVESSPTSIADITSTDPVASPIVVKQDICRSCSDMTRGYQSMDSLFDKSSHLDLRRSSVTSVDIERSKLETEVELLMKRLKIIQQGREKLSFPVEHRERESFQLQLLEEIARQLQEIRKITKPERTVRQASLPPPSTKLTSKKRRCRSVSRSVHGSL